MISNLTPAGRRFCEIFFYTASGGGFTVFMNNPEDMKQAHDEITEAMINGLGVVNFTSRDGEVTIDTGQIYAATTSTYWRATL